MSAFIQAKLAASTLRTWKEMISRCHDEKHTNPKNWARYGGRGISVCDHWRYSQENFINDMGIRPAEGMELDRINNDGNYEPGNCRWVTKRENCQNRSTSIAITWNGITKNASEWARDFKLGASTFHQRYNSGMPMDQIRDTPLIGTTDGNVRNRRNAVMLSHNGKTQTMAAWAREIGTTVPTLWRRKNDGWSDEKIIATPIAKYREEVLFTFNGKTQNQEAWAKELGLSGNAIHQRRKLGLPIEQILSTESLLKGYVCNTFEFRGGQRTVAEIAKELNIHHSLVSRRIKEGIKPDDMKPRKAGYEREVKLTYAGKTQNITQWAKELNITVAKIRWGLSQKWSIDTILNKG